MLPIVYVCAEAPGEVLCADYLYIGPSNSTAKYCLVCVDKFSRLTEIRVTEEAEYIPFADELIWWAGRHGVPDWLVTDGGTHFRNKQSDGDDTMAERLGIEHHVTVTTAYSPWVLVSAQIGYAVLHQLTVEMWPPFRDDKGCVREKVQPSFVEQYGRVSRVCHTAVVIICI